MKILLLGDASNYHHTLAVGLRRLGHHVTVASNGSEWMNTPRDITLRRRPGLIGGGIYWLRLNSMLSSQLSGYDVVQISNPVFIEQRPGRVRQFFDKLRRRNGAVYLTALGTDTPYTDMCIDSSSPLRYNEWRVNDRPTDYAAEQSDVLQQWQTNPLRDHCRYIYDNVDGVGAALYEYWLACKYYSQVPNLVYAGIPVDTQSVTMEKTDEELGPMRILIACHIGREKEKGMHLLAPALEDFARGRGDVLIDKVQNVPYSQYITRLKSAHVVADQMYSYTPATSALLTMAMGKVTLSGGEEDYYKFIGEERLRPIINVEPLNLDALLDKLAQLAQNPAMLALLGRQGREFVERHNSCEVVARRFISLYEHKR